MPWSLVLILLAQTPASPGVAVVVSRRASISSGRALELAHQVEDALVAARVPVALGAEAASRRLAELGEAEPETCQGDPKCLARLGARLGVPIVVGIEAGQLDRDIALHLDATRVTQATSVADQIVVLNGAAPQAADSLAREIAPFARAVAALVPEVVPPPQDALTVARPELAAAASPSPLRQWAWTPAVTGAALAGASGWLLLEARARYVKLTDDDVSALRISDAVRFANEGKTFQGLGLTLAVLGAGALVTAGAMYWAGRPPEPRPGPSLGIAVARGELWVVAGGSFP